MNIHRNRKRRVFAALLFVASATLITASNGVVCQQKSSPATKTSLRRVINRNGWIIPGRDSFKIVSSTRRKEIDGLDATIVVYKSRTETFVQLDGYFVDDTNALVINSSQCVVRDLLAYQFAGKVFAWEVTLVPVTNTQKEKGSTTYPGALYELFFIDYDGDGKFETRLGALSLKEVPLWVKKLKE